MLSNLSYDLASVCLYKNCRGKKFFCGKRKELFARFYQLAIHVLENNIKIWPKNRKDFWQKGFDDEIMKAMNNAIRSDVRGMRICLG